MPDSGSPIVRLAIEPRPGYFNPSGIAVLFDSVEPCMRRRGATPFIKNCDHGRICAERCKDQLAIFTHPGLDQVWKLFRVIPRSQRKLVPGNNNFVTIPGGRNPVWRAIVGRLWQRDVGRGNIHHIPFYLHQRGFDPARIIPADGPHQDPRSQVIAANDFKVASLNQCVLVKIRGAGTITAVGKHEDFTPQDNVGGDGRSCGRLRGKLGLGGYKRWGGEMCGREGGCEGWRSRRSFQLRGFGRGLRNRLGGCRRTAGSSYSDKD